jgi:hypothetical protein
MPHTATAAPHLYLDGHNDNVTGVKRSSRKHHYEPGLRGFLQRYRPAATLAALVIFIGSVLFVIWYQASAEQKPLGIREFFTDDDGTTWFADDGTKLAPFDHKGKQAVVAKVFVTHSGQKFVGYLIKFTDEAKKKILDSRANGLPRGLQKVDPHPSSGILLKKPHVGDWVPDNDPAARAIRKFTAPDGSTDYEPVPAGR